MISRSLLLLLLLGLLSFASPATAQTRDHLTPQEVDLVKMDIEGAEAAESEVLRVGQPTGCRTFDVPVHVRHPL